MKKIEKKAFAFFALVSVCLLFLSACGQRSAEEGKTGALPQINVGCDVYPPYSYADADGKPTGVDVDLAKEAFRRMGYEPNFIYIDWESKKELLEDGTIDCIWSSFSINGREQDYRWAGPYMVSRQVVAVMPESSIYELSDLAGKKVAVQTTTKPEEIFLAHEDDRVPVLDRVFSLQNRELIYPMLSKGYVDAVAAHETSIRQYMADYGVEYRILDEPLLLVGLGVAFRSDDERGIAEALGKTLDEMRSDGTSEQIIGKYLDGAARYLEVDSYAD